MKAVMYHYVRQFSPDWPYQRYLDIGDFRAQLDFFATTYGFVSKSEFLAAVRDGRATAGVVLTFDDGLSDHLTFVLPELVKRGLWGIFYVATGPYVSPGLLAVHRVHALLAKFGGVAMMEAMARVTSDAMLVDAEVPAFRSRTYTRQDNSAATTEFKRAMNYYISYEHRDRALDAMMSTLGDDEGTLAGRYYMSPADLRALSDAGMIVGSHTVTHPVLAKLAPEAQRKEIADSFATLAGILGGQEIMTFCYPYGGRHSFAPETERLLSAAGVHFSFDVDQRDVTDNDLRVRRQALPRYDCNQFPHGRASGPP
jgi:peptidoglycan/xylan/chitin deacetylase (PgdA/CDA1 family)